jgi:hypothetical protein
MNAQEIKTLIEANESIQDSVAILDEALAEYKEDKASYGKLGYSPKVSLRAAVVYMRMTRVAAKVLLAGSTMVLNKELATLSYEI